MAPAKTKFVSFKEGSVLRSALIEKKDGLAVKLEDIMSAKTKYVIAVYKTEAETFHAIGVDEIDGFKFVDMIIYAKTDPKEFVMIIRDIFPKGTEMILQSGVCMPKKEDFEAHNLQEDGCIWEGILKFPDTVNVNDISTQIMERDTNGIIADVAFIDIF